MNPNPATPSGDTNPPADSSATAWTAERIRALGPVTDLPTAAKILRIGRTLAYQMVREGRFPVPTISVGTRYYRVPVASILEVLHLTGADLTASATRSVDQQRQPDETRSGATNPDTTAGPQ